MIKLLTQAMVGKWATTFLLSMVPVIELRGGLPYGVSLGLSYPEALIAAILGNMVPVPFIILYIRHIFHWLKKRSPWWQEKITALEKKAHLKGRLVHKYSAIGLCILVAIPFPGTGAWTGTLAASILDMDFKTSVLAVMGGVLLASVIMLLASSGVFGAIGALLA